MIPFLTQKEKYYFALLPLVRFKFWKFHRCDMFGVKIPSVKDKKCMKKMQDIKLGSIKTFLHVPLTLFMQKIYIDLEGIYSIWKWRVWKHSLFLNASCYWIRSWKPACNVFWKLGVLSKKILKCPRLEILNTKLCIQ